MRNRRHNIRVSATSASSIRVKPALARLDMHSWHDLIECCARSFYAMGQESQARPGAHAYYIGYKLINPGLGQGLGQGFKARLLINGICEFGN